MLQHVIHDSTRIRKPQNVNVAPPLKRNYLAPANKVANHRERTVILQLKIYSHQ